MPSRYLRSGYVDSRKINMLSAEGERMFCRLVVHVDDFGRCEAYPDLLRGKLFALQLEKVSRGDVERWLAELASIDAIMLYSVRGEEYLQMQNWERGRAQQSKHPAPPDSKSEAKSEKEGEPSTEEAGSTSAEAFDAFWSAYPRKIGKANCRATWKRCFKKMPEIKVILDAIEIQKKSQQWMSEGGKYIPYPQTWLRRHGWEDETSLKSAKEIGSFEQ